MTKAARKPLQADLADSPFELSRGLVTLRPFTREHARSDEYLGWMNDPLVTRTIGRFDYLMPVSRAKLEDYFSSIDPESTLFLAIEHRKTPRSKPVFIGTLKLYDIDPLVRRASIGIMVGDRSAWGSGIATSAIDAICGYVFDTLGFSKITAGYVASNTGMHRVFEKCGFAIEGILREHLFLEGQLEDHVLVARFRTKSQ